MSFFTPPHIPKPFEHQTYTTQRILDDRFILNASDAGTGKTRGTLDALDVFCRETGNAALVLAPKSILQAAWQEDAKKFTPALQTSIAYAHNRKKAFETPADLYITNHDASKWLAKHLELLQAAKVKAVVIDESSAFKHHTSQRSKAMRYVIEQLDPEIVVLMSATPNMNNPLDIWHQAYLLDQGERLGKSFYRFRQSVCDIKPNGFANDWVPKEDAHEAIADILSDITVRFKLEDCAAIPQHSQIKIDLELDALTRKAYDTLREQAKLELEGGTVTAVNAAVLHNKLLQTSSGAVYDQNHNTATLSTARAEYVTQLVQERDQCVVAFQWKHQLLELIESFQSAGVSYRIIDGSVSNENRSKAVRDFNNHEAKVILAHPRSAGHGLTLTAGTTTIWPSPISDAELFYQFNRRIYRTGQTKKTQTIVITGKDCIDQATYDRCVGRIDTQMTTLELLQHNL